MYDCNQTEDFLGLYLDNELEAVETQRVAAHLEDCARCRLEFERMRSQQNALASSLRSEVYETDRLRESIQAATFGRSHRLLDFKGSRIAAWSLSAAAVLVIAFATLFYLPGRFGNTSAHPLYDEAAADHWSCSARVGESDWIVSQAAIVEKAKAFLKSDARLPLTAGNNYALVRARLCLLSGQTFLHLVYETADGRQASLFLCNRAAAIPEGDSHFKIAGRTAQSVGLSNLNLVSVLDGGCLMIAAAREDGVDVALIAGLLS